MNVDLTNGERLWLWRKRLGLTPREAAARRGVNVLHWSDSEHDVSTHVKVPLDSDATDAELLRVLRRRSCERRHVLAERLGVSHVTWLKWERSTPPDPRLVAFWDSYDWEKKPG